MNPFIPGMIVGIALALLNFSASTFYSSRTLSKSNKMTSIVLTLIGFIARLTIIGVIFYALTKVKWIHFQTSLITFVIFFTLCTLWRATRFYREAKSFMKQQTER